MRIDSDYKGKLVVRIRNKNYNQIVNGLYKKLRSHYIARGIRAEVEVKKVGKEIRTDNIPLYCIRKAIDKVMDSNLRGISIELPLEDIVDSGE